MLGLLEGLPLAVTFSLAVGVFVAALIGYHYLAQIFTSEETSPSLESPLEINPKASNRETVWGRIENHPSQSEPDTLLGKLREGKLENDLEQIRATKAQKEAKEADTFDVAWADIQNDEVPFVRIRHIAHEFKLDFSSTDSATSNMAYRLEGELRQAAVDGRLKVRGRKYRGPVKSNDPLVSIPSSHFEDFEFAHGSLHYETPNDATHTGVIGESLEQLSGQVYYDLHISYTDTRVILKDFVAKENVLTDELKPSTADKEKYDLARRIAAAPDTSEFDYPSLVAVLRAEIDGKTGSKEALAGKPPHKVSVLMRIANVHDKPMNDCLVQLKSIKEGSFETTAHQLFKVGKKAKFQTNPSQTNNFYFLKRDMSDPITPRPFVLVLEDQEKPLNENTNYLLKLKLISPYPIATIVEVEVETGEGVEVSCVIRSQYLEGYE